VVLAKYSVDHVPFLSIKARDDIREAAVYVRRERLTAEASHDELLQIINRRIEAGYSTSDEVDLRQHLEQLRILYSEVPRYISTMPFDKTWPKVILPPEWFHENSAALKEDFPAFICKMIEAKKAVIAKSLNIPNPA